MLAATIKALLDRGSIEHVAKMLKATAVALEAFDIDERRKMKAEKQAKAAKKQLSAASSRFKGAIMSAKGAARRKAEEAAARQREMDKTHHPSMYLGGPAEGAGWREPKETPVAQTMTHAHKLLREAVHSVRVGRALNSTLREMREHLYGPGGLTSAHADNLEFYKSQESRAAKVKARQAAMAKRRAEVAASRKRAKRRAGKLHLLMARNMTGRQQSESDGVDAGLNSLLLSHNQVGDQAAVRLAEWIPQAVRLHTLALANTGLTDARAVAILRALQQHNSLTNLDVSRNQLGPTTAAAMASLMRTDHALQQLNLSWNHLEAEGAFTIAEALASSSSLRDLDLECNHVGEGAIDVAKAMASHRSIRQLNLRGNSVSGEACQHLATAIVSCKSLRVIHLDGNPIGSSGAHAILSALHRRSAQAARARVSGHVPAWQIPRGNSVSVSISGCDLPLEDLKLFDSKDPGGVYELDVSHIYDRYVFLQVMKRAEERAGFTMEHVRYVGTDDVEVPLYVVRVPFSGCASEGKVVMMRESDDTVFETPSSGTLKLVLRWERYPASIVPPRYVADSSVATVVEEAMKDLEGAEKMRLVEVMCDDGDVTCSQAKNVLAMPIVKLADGKAKVSHMARCVVG